MNLTNRDTFIHNAVMTYIEHKIPAEEAIKDLEVYLNYWDKQSVKRTSIDISDVVQVNTYRERKDISSGLEVR
jgi:hypothetical protein